MFTHLIKIMWNKRGSNTLLFLEILLAFVVLFGVYTFAYYTLERYFQPLGWEYDEALVAQMSYQEGLDSAGAVELQRSVLREVREVPGVRDVALFGDVSPFQNHNWSFSHDENGFRMDMKMFFAGENFAEVAGLNIIDGRWYEDQDRHAKYQRVVVNQAFVDAYFPDAASIVDSVLIFNEGEAEIIGVVEYFKYNSNFSDSDPLAFFSQREMDMNEYPFYRLFIVAQPGKLAAVQEPVYRILSDLTKNPDVVIKDLDSQRAIANRPIVLPLIILTTISAFVLINIALGLFGVLFTQINRRRAEIGLRKAMGATPGEVTAQFVGEVLVVTAAGLLLGIFFAVQVPLLELLPIPGKYFYLGIGAAIATILLIVTLCALLPSRQAARLHPADVLHEE